MFILPRKINVVQIYNLPRKQNIVLVVLYLPRSVRRSDEMKHFERNYVITIVIMMVVFEQKDSKNHLD